MEGYFPEQVCKINHACPTNQRFVVYNRKVTPEKERVEAAPPKGPDISAFKKKAIFLGCPFFDIFANPFKKFYVRQKDFHF